MNNFSLIYKNLKYYFRTNIWILLGTMMSTAIITGALIIGDSVKFSLNKIVQNRLGNTTYALTSGDRFFRSQLADEIAQSKKNVVAPLLQTRGMAVADGGSRRVNNIQVYGINNKFENISSTKNIYSDLSADEIVVNSHLADKLQLKQGDEFLLRYEKLDSMPKETPLSSDEESTIAKRYTVKHIASDEELGRFGLKNEQVAPDNVFLNLQSLSADMKLHNKANMLLFADKANLNIAELNRELVQNWKLEDYGIELSDLNNSSEIELRSKRIFLDGPLIKSVRDTKTGNEKILTYFVNEIKNKNNSASYSFLSATEKVKGIKENEIVINSWLAVELKAKPGDKLKVKYFTIGEKRNLVEDSTFFIVKSIAPIKGIYADKDLMPDFPGLIEAESCLDWHPGIPVDFDKIKKRDENYWDKYRGTPKGFVSLKTAQKLWNNRFGSLTAIRFKEIKKEELENQLLANLSPSDYGMEIIDVKTSALNASSKSVDFSGLFIGLSFFIIIASLLLTGLLFILNVESRSEEQGILLGIGFTKERIRKIVLTETFILVLLGSILGVITGIGYNQIVLTALKSIWSDIVRTSALEMYVNPVTVFTGLSAGVIITMITVLLFLRGHLKNTTHQLQRSAAGLKYIFKSKSKLSLISGIAGVALSLIILFITESGKGSERFGTFFLVGVMILSSGIFFINHWMNRLLSKNNNGKINLFTTAVKTLAVNRKRSLMLLGLLASGLFIVFTVGVNKKSVPADLSDRKSGTGGFSYIAEMSLPFYNDLNNSEIQEEYNLTNLSVDKITFVQFRIKEGDDASCLNLNRVTNPQVLGVDTKVFAELNPFRVKSAIENFDAENPWKELEKNNQSYVPAIANETDIIWQMGKAVGDTLTYTADNGERFVIRLVAGLENSIFQGNIIISEKAFLQKFNTVTGSKLFLLNNIAKAKQLSEELSNSLIDYGITLTRTTERLAQFNKIENTYLSIFLILGSFGIFLGSFGISIVVFRNVYEQKSELALMQAVGIEKRMIKKMIVQGHLLLLFAGILIGLTASLFTSFSSIDKIPYLLITLIILIVTANGIFWTHFSAEQALSSDLLPSLRKE